VHSSPDSKRSEALASQLHAAQARERALAAELQQLQHTLTQLQQKQHESEFPNEDADLQGKRQRVQCRSSCASSASAVKTFPWLCSCKTSGIPQKLTCRMRTKRFEPIPISFDSASVMPLQELLASLSSSAAAMPHLVRERVADSIGQQCSTQ
jgi:hypothetical protein